MPASRVLAWLLPVAAACGTPPPPRQSAPPERARPSVHAPETDDCAPVDGKPVEPLARKYEGVAAKARCQREVYTIMGFVTVALGQPCEYCHVPEKYSEMTHRKEIANWMAQKLVPSLQKHGGGEVWCKDCHQSGQTGRAKILGDPRSRSWAIEWMSTHLAEKFDTVQGDPLRCKTCHAGNVGSKEWNPKVILTDHLPPVPARPLPPAEPERPDAGEPLDAGAAVTGSQTASDAAVTDGG